MQNNDWFGRILGTIVFLAGVLLLIYVFNAAHGMFTSDKMGLIVTPAKNAAQGATNQLGESAIKLFARIGLLLLMALVSSLIASKGIQLYFASTTHKTKAVIEDAD